MPSANPQAIVRVQDSQIGHNLPYLALGEAPSIVPDLNLEGQIGEPCAGIILLGRVVPAELNEALDSAPDTAVPIADFGRNDTLRHDFSMPTFDAASIGEMEKVFAPIRWRLASIPFIAEQPSRTALTILRLAYSRNVAIEAVFSPGSHRLVEYPLLGVSAGVQRQLESLAKLRLLHRRHFTRTHICPKCDSARLHVYEACPSCGSGDLKEETLVHHYRCGCQEVESRFKQGDLLVCPKCRRTLRHFGVDYGKPGQAVVCSTCSATNSDPFVQFACLDCASITSAESAATTDWYHYDLTDDAVLALRHGSLPQFDMQMFVGRRTDAHTMDEFRLLVAHELKLAARFKGPFTVARFSAGDIEEHMRRLGPVEAEASFRRTVNAVMAELRSTDFVGVGADMTAFVGLPGTSSSDLETIIQKIEKTVNATATSHVDLQIEAAEGDVAIADLLARG